MFRRKLFEDYVPEKTLQNLTITFQFYNGLCHVVKNQKRLDILDPYMDGLCKNLMKYFFVFYFRASIDLFGKMTKNQWLTL